ncbi:MAG: DUF1566 domain-containing protein [Patescibacteria group bacterium]|nr:DUF1566 domain-containing protein [Patescibacteria group bacterium]
MEWADKTGGDLPDRIEQALMFAFLRDKFKEVAYWSNTQNADCSGYAWFQNFRNGGQNCYRKGSIIRARAVRRLPV